MTPEQRSETDRCIFREANDAFVIIRPADQQVLDVNPAAQRLAGLRRKQLLGINLAVLLEGARPGALAELVHACQTTGYFAPADGYHLKTPGGGRRAAQVSASRIHTEPEPLGLVVIRDVSGQKQAEEALRENEACLRLALEAARMGTWEWDPGNGRMTLSPAAYRLFGLAPEAFGGTFEAFLACVHEEDRERIRHAVGPTPGGGPGPDVEYRLRRGSDGSYRWQLGRALPVWDAEGRVVRWFGTCTDIHDKKEAEAKLRERAEEVEKLMELMPVSVWIARDPGCQTITGNRAGYDLLRMPAGANLSQSAPAGERPTRFRVYRGGKEIPPHELPMQYAAAHGVDVRAVEEDLVFDDGAVVPVYGSATPLFDERGRVRACIAAFMDVSELRRLEEELRQKMAELAEADRQKDDFLAMLGHELRNPVAAVLSSVERLRLRGPPDPVTQGATERIGRQVQHLTRLLDDLLDATRIRRGTIRLQREPLELAAVVAQAVETIRPLLDARKHQLTVSLPPEPMRLEADLTRLVQVVSNLLHNAAKYTPEGGRIGLAAEREAGEVVLQVRDTGNGIPAELLPRVFDLFRQGEQSLARSEGGLGIGLTLVKGLVELHGGSVQALSEGPGQGSLFVVRLPVGAAPQGPPLVGGGEEGGRPPDARRILLVEDNRDIAEGFALLFKDLGHEVRVVHDGPAALEVAQAFRPELVLLDIGLPGMDGWEVARRVRKLPGLENPVLAAVTGYAQEEDRRRSAEAGVDYHLVKPVDLTALRELIAGLGPPVGRRSPGSEG
jgi:two-component system CheB/CheR fusion protein